MIKNGINICIQEIDVPSLGKRGNYGNFVDSNGVYISNLETLDILLNDPSEAFGHGLCICYALHQDLRNI